MGIGTGGQPVEPELGGLQKSLRAVRSLRMLIRERCQISCRQAIGHTPTDFSDRVDGIDPPGHSPPSGGAFRVRSKAGFSAFWL